MENVIHNLTKANTYKKTSRVRFRTLHVSKGSSVTVQDAHTCMHRSTHMHAHARTHAHTHTHTHTHMHIVQTDMGEGQCCLTEIFGDEKCLEFGRGNSRVPDVLGSHGDQKSRHCSVRVHKHP